MQRFFLSEEAFQGEVVYFPEDISHQIARVLRMQVGDQVVAINPAGNEFTLRLSDVNPKICIGEVESIKAAEGEPVVQVDIYVAFTQRDKFEWILQKCTEVGAASITPVITERSLPINKEKSDKKNERWQRILKEAAEQCERGRVPTLGPVMDYEAVCSSVRADRRLIAYARDDVRNLKSVLGEGQINRVALLIGPEGGFSQMEVQGALASGWQAFNLGKRILRMETAAVVAASLVLYELDELGV